MQCKVCEELQVPAVPVSDFLLFLVLVRAAVSTLQQRLSHPSGQHFLTHSLLPRRKALSTKLAQRCSHCHKHLVKPGPGASKPSFEIHMPAVSFIPAVTIAQFPPLSVGEETDIMSVVCKIAGESLVTQERS
jgi:hypothetical protein